VFKLDQKGKETVLYNFSGGTDGCQPGAGVILDSAGNLYGTTYAGGNGSCDTGDGVVFKLDTSGHETVLYSFSGPDGANPSSVLLFDSLGTLYGTTVNGGIGCHNGICGTVFELAPMAGLTMDPSGNLYGTALRGGDDYCHGSYEGCGVVFKITP
jgi:uncharacterized repeat protein (TIGR03803 family)